MISTLVIGSKSMLREPYGRVKSGHTITAEAAELARKPFVMCALRTRLYARCSPNQSPGQDPETGRIRARADQGRFDDLMHPPRAEPLRPQDQHARARV